MEYFYYNRVAFMMSATDDEYYVRMLIRGYESDDIIEDRYYSARNALQIIDRDFKVIATFELPRRTYDIYRSFFLKGKFYLSTNNYLNEDSSEDVLSFDVFNFASLVKK